ncbi:MAG TPA: ABC transporter substrate-binding protein [Micromonosporaceae bacterium]
MKFKQGAGTDLLPEYIAKAKGFFAAYNLEVELVPAKVGGVAWIPLLASGQLDATAGAGVSAPIVSRGNGAKVVAVAAGFITTDTFHNFGLWAAKSAGVKSQADLVGKRIAIANVGSTIDIGIDAWLRAGGVDPAQVKKVVIPYANMPTALKSNQVDAIGEILPIMDPWLKANPTDADKVELVRYDNELLPSAKLYTAYSMREDFVRQNPAVVQAWIAAMTEATEWVVKNPREAAEIAVAAKAIPSVEVPTPGWPKGLCIDGSESKTWMDMLERAGQVKPGAVGLNDWFTNEFNPSGCP